MTHLDDAMASALWNEWRALTSESLSWRVYNRNRVKRSREVGRYDWDEECEIEAAAEYIYALAAVKLAEYKLVHAGVDIRKGFWHEQAQLRDQTGLQFS